jgi:hypothetical protein
MYCIPHCFICRPSDSTVSEDAGIEPRTVATMVLALAVFIFDKKTDVRRPYRIMSYAEPLKNTTTNLADDKILHLYKYSIFV